ncbi:MAG: tRNA uridine(34) 5-carboxymethylaminomethyl modification radical SAM/GNAT enzyme Elp3 [Candidatus Thermoplasmatota archaeon]
MPYYEEVIQQILTKKIQTKQDLHSLKLKLCKKYNLKKIPSDSEILAYISDTFLDDDETILSLLRKKSTRTLSGVAVVAVMTSPEHCPHGRCVPCPGGPTHETPQSYTGHEPAALRAINHHFDPYIQARSRLDQLKSIGHPVDKIDLIIMGGTFTARTPWYQEWFVKECYDALNNKHSRLLYRAQKNNEHALSRCIGLTLETRPDWFRMQHADHALRFGATRIELGVQHIDDSILYRIHRGHTVHDIISATRLAKETGFKVCYHIMPGLPGSNSKKDLEAFKKLFTDERFQPDMLKIYPVLVIQGTQLYDQWTKKEYEPLTVEKAAVLIAKMKQFIPPWVRIQRIQRDIPAQLISAGITKSNLRQYVLEELQKHGKTCKCIRCREIGFASLRKKIEITNIRLDTIRTEYSASGGKEFFLSLEDSSHDVIVGYLRLRDVVSSHRLELNRDSCMIIRELKILGRELSLGDRANAAWQHRGLGKRLISEAESICKDEFGRSLLFVLSGVGVKPYYRKLGFVDNGPFLCKKL